MIRVKHIAVSDDFGKIKLRKINAARYRIILLYERDEAPESAENGSVGKARISAQRPGWKEGFAAV